MRVRDCTCVGSAVAVWRPWGHRGYRLKTTLPRR
ncbi:MAG: hypothetical protein RLZZ401_1916, partial [Pseudomonadota bacterium]